MSEESNLNQPSNPGGESGRNAATGNPLPNIFDQSTPALDDGQNILNETTLNQGTSQGGQETFQAAKSHDSGSPSAQRGRRALCSFHDPTHTGWS